MNKAADLAELDFALLSSLLRAGDDTDELMPPSGSTEAHLVTTTEAPFARRHALYVQAPKMPSIKLLWGDWAHSWMGAACCCCGQVSL